jgi:hypothetical protein
MAENKKSFIAYSDWNGMFKMLPDEVAGKLIKHIFSYVNDENPSTDDFIVNALFEQIKATLKRDLQKWESQKEQRSLAGKRSAEIRATKSNDRSISLNENVRNPTVSVSVSDNVNVSVNENVFLKEIFDFKKLKSTEWANQFCKAKSLPLEKFNTIFDNFLTDVILKGQHLDYKDPEKEVKRHFVNWYDKNPPQTTQPTYKRNPVIK